jgi:hexosaminidase
VKTKKIALPVLIAFIALFNMACSKKENINIIPVPVSITEAKGTFELMPDATISFNDNRAASTASFLAGMLKPATGFEFSQTMGPDGAIVLNLDATKEWRQEEYNLAVTRKQVIITAGTTDGLFMGIQTLRQLLPVDIESGEKENNVRWEIPCVTINDYPRFAWRGMQLDVSRHFFDVDFVKKYIDLIAMHKMNVFHWHLVDDQG